MCRFLCGYKCLISLSSLTITDKLLIFTIKKNKNNLFWVNGRFLILWLIYRKQKSSWLHYACKYAKKQWPTTYSFSPYLNIADFHLQNQVYSDLQKNVYPGKWDIKNPIFWDSTQSYLLLSHLWMGIKIMTLDSDSVVIIFDTSRDWCPVFSLCVNISMFLYSKLLS